MLASTPYLCALKFKNIIWSLGFILVSLLSQEAIAIDNAVSDSHITVVEKDIHSKDKEKNDFLNRSFALENFLLKTSAQSNPSRTVERHFLDGFFLTYFADSHKHLGSNTNQMRGPKFVPHALIIIYPHHHFW